MTSTNQKRLFLAITAGRLIIFILLLICAQIFPKELPNGNIVIYLYYLLGAAFFFTAIYISWYQRYGLTKGLKNTQVVVDVFLVTITIYLTGGLESPFTFLYSVAIITACLISPDNTGNLSAILCTFFYAFVSILTYRKVDSVDSAFFSFFLNMGAFNTIAVLSVLSGKEAKVG